jgi:hypothetical protein
VTVGFFDDPPPRPPDLVEPEPAPEPWEGAPTNELGVSVPVRLELVRTDGARRATIFDGPFGIGDDAQRIVLLPGGGSGGVGGWDEQYWVAPLPPPGPVAFVCEWPAAGIALTRGEVDAAAFTADGDG